MAPFFRPALKHKVDEHQWMEAVGRFLEIKEMDPDIKFPWEINSHPDEPFYGPILRRKFPIMENRNEDRTFFPVG